MCVEGCQSSLHGFCWNCSWPCSSGVSCGGHCRSMGCLARCSTTSSHCTTAVRRWSVLPEISCTRFWLCQGCCMSLTLFTNLWTKLLDVTKWLKASTLVASEFHLCFMQMMWFYWLHQFVVSNSHWSGSQLNMKQQVWELAPPSPRPWSLAWKQCRAHARSCTNCLQVEEFKYLQVSFTSKGRETDRQIGTAAAMMWTLVCQSEERD